MPNKNEFYFSYSELQRLRGNRRIEELNLQAARALPRCLARCKRKQYQELAESLAQIGHELKALQKRRLDILAYANEPHPTKIIIDFGRHCQACEALPMQNEQSDLVVLAALEACPIQPELDSFRGLADLAEDLLISGFNSRAGSGRASLTRALSALQSALLGQKTPLPRVRHSSSFNPPDIVVRWKRFECTRCGKSLRWEWAHEDPRYQRALCRLQERKAHYQGQSEPTCNTVEGRAK
jgi:hypothetical protein